MNVDFEYFYAIPSTGDFEFFGSNPIFSVQNWQERDLVCLPWVCNLVPPCWFQEQKLDTWPT